MDEQYRELAAAIQAQASRSPHKRFLVAIAGPPGSGKSSIAAKIIQILNSDGSPANLEQAGALAVPMDGFHLSRATLDQMPNSTEAYIRRGAPWTFDAKGSLDFVERLRKWADDDIAIEGTALYAPSFDHALKDPVENGIAIVPSTKIVILEGIYLLLDESYWREISGLVDMRVFVDVDEGEARMRVARRHVEAGIEMDLDGAIRRVDCNDTLNGRLIRAKIVKPVDVVIKSVHELQTTAQ